MANPCDNKLISKQDARNLLEFYDLREVIESTKLLADQCKFRNISTSIFTDCSHEKIQKHVYLRYFVTIKFKLSSADLNQNFKIKEVNGKNKY